MFFSQASVFIRFFGSAVFFSLVTSGLLFSIPSFAGRIVCVYTGEGTEKFVTDKLIKKIEAFTTEDRVVRFDDPAALEAFLIKHRNSDLTLVFPGGHTGEMLGAFLEKGRSFTKEIRDSIRNGSHYLGMCAGGYLACQSLSGRFNSQSEISEPMTEQAALENRTLFGSDDHFNLLPSQAYFFSHSIPPYPARMSFPGKWVQIKAVLQGSLKTFSGFWHSGSYFKFPEHAGNSLVHHAQYGDDAIVKDSDCVISSHFGKGRVVACAFHPEISSEDFVGAPQPEGPSPSQADCRLGGLLLEELFRNVGLTEAKKVIDQVTKVTSLMSLEEKADQEKKDDSSGSSNG